MSRSAKVRAFFGDAPYDFALRIRECEELQELFDCGLEQTRERLIDIRTKDIQAVLRLGLIGGGMDKEAAYNLVTRHVVPGDLAEPAVLAVRIVNAAIVGAPDEDLGESLGSEIGDLRSPEESSDTPISTPPAPSSASPRKTSRKPRSGS